MNIIFVSGVAGAGKSSICDYLNSNGLLSDYVIFDIDDLENVNDYSSDNYSFFYDNAIKKAIGLANGKNILMASCINPSDIKNIPSLDGVNIKMILLTCLDDVLTKRLMDRDKKRGCGDQEFITGQIDYQKWLIANGDGYDLTIDNTYLDIDNVASEIAKYISLYKNK